MDPNIHQSRAAKVLLLFNGQLLGDCSSDQHSSYEQSGTVGGGKTELKHNVSLHLMVLFGVVVKQHENSSLILKPSLGNPIEFWILARFARNQDGFHHLFLPRPILARILIYDECIVSQ